MFSYFNKVFQKRKWVQTVILIIVTFSSVSAQELEPRALTNLPLKTNFFIAAYGFSRGGIMMDSSLPIEDYYGEIHTTVLAYARAVNFFGKSGKVDVVVPFAYGDWSGTYNNEHRVESSSGLGDIRIRASINLTGAPALKASEFQGYKQKTVSGLSLQLIIPTGSYDTGQLSNLGSNRWALRTTYGISHSFNKWIIEAYGGVWLFTENKEYLRTHSFSQPPFLVIKAHITRLFNKGRWLAFDCGYGYGSEALVDGQRNEVVLSGMKIGVTYALPLSNKHTLKFTAVSGLRFEQGGDFDIFGVAYQYRWNK